MDILTDVLIELTSGTGLKARVETRQPKELKVFDSLRLSVVVTTEITAKVAAKVLTVVLAEVAAELVTELGAQVKIQQPKKLKVFNSLRLSIVLLIAIHY